LHNKEHLMAELEKIVRVIRKTMPSAPHATVLTLDATTGQNALAQAEAFKAATPLSGLIITKLDGTARGGVVLAVAEKHKLPIFALGVGETATDLQPFTAQDYAKALCGV
ncbi:MAG: signal recognition particle-docking protein FtsY, partial [Alphaproteobacteria bacterium]|nr:signal recognition particle-docking protein FtsY [Alphaproteobacteria bacterium]